MSKKRDWFKWKLRAGTRGTIRRTSRRTGNGFEVMGACIAMLDHARGASHWTENPEGVFTTTIEDLATDYSTQETRVREVLGALVGTGWLRSSGDVAAVDSEDDIHFRIVRYLAFNDPQGSSTDRKAAERDSEIVAAKAMTYRSLLESDVDAARVSEAVDLQRSVTTSADSDGWCTEGEGEREGEGEQEEITISSPSLPKDDLARRLFDHWLSVTKRNANQNRLTKKRVGLIRARRSDGYEEAHLFAAIDGIARSPWHSGENPSGTRYDTFDFIFRSGENIEKGIERTVTDANRAAAGTPVQSTQAVAPRHHISEEYDDGIQWHTNEPAA